MVASLFQKDECRSVLPAMGTEEMSENVTTLETKRKSIESGALVTLKTGGPKMVVHERGADRVHCWWHDNEGNLIHDWLPTSILVAAP